MKTVFSMIALTLSFTSGLTILLMPMMHEVGILSLGWCVLEILLLALLTYLLFQLSVALVDSPKKKAH